MYMSHKIILILKRLDDVEANDVNILGGFKNSAFVRLRLNASTSLFRDLF